MVLINKVKGKIANSKFLTWYLSTSFHDVMKKVENFLYRHIFCYSDVRFVLLLYLVGLLAFGYVLIQNYFVIPVSGDFVIQEIPFYYNGYDKLITMINDNFEDTYKFYPEYQGKGSISIFQSLIVNKQKINQSKFQYF